MRGVYQCVVGVLVAVLMAGCTVLTQAQTNEEATSESAQPNTTTPTTPATSTTEPTQLTSTSTTPSQPAGQAPVERLALTGSGNKTTEKFSVGPEWTVEWSYDCAEQFGSVGIFHMWPKNDGVIDLLPVMSSMGKPKAADIQNYHKAGEFYLDILSTCDWSITVRG